MSIFNRITMITTTALAVTITTSQAFAYEAPKRARGTTILNVKNYGAKGNGVADDTAAIQKAINALPSAGGTVQVPAGTYMINAAKVANGIYGLKLRSKMHFQMLSGASLKTITNSSERSSVLSVIGISDVEISGGKILGDRATHKGTTGEWGHAITVKGSKRVTVRDIVVRDNWGDGMSIGATGEATSTYSDDVIIDDMWSTNNRRQGLSIGRSTNVKVYDSEFSYTNGTAPQYGIDIEPDPVGSFSTRGVRIENSRFHHNKGGGILVYKETYDVVIKGNEIYNNPYGVYVVGSYDGYIAANWIEHNEYQGIALRGTTDNYKVYANTLRNNHTAVYGEHSNNTPTTPIEGIKSGAAGTSPHLNIANTATNLEIGINYCAQ